MSIFEEPKKLQAWFDRVKGDRGPVDTIRQEIADNLIGSRDFTIDRPFPRDRMVQIYDTTALFANEILAGALHGLINNPASVWFEVHTADKRLMDNFDVLDWLEHVRDVMLLVTVTPGSGFVTNLAELYLDLPAFGMGAMMVLEDPRFGARFSARPLREIYVEDDDLGTIDVVFRELKITARQFGIRFPNPMNEIPEVGNALAADNPEHRLTVLQLIAKSDDPYAGTSPFRKTWTAVTWGMGRTGPAVIERAGYDEMPLITPRWKVETGEVYARGPGWTALPSGKMVNSMKKTILKAAQKAADPPLLVSDEAVLGAIRTMPGGINYVQDRPGIGGQPEAIRPLDNRARLELGVDMLQLEREDIRNAFWYPALQMFTDPRMSATQVVQIAAQAQRMMASATGRATMELNDPLLTRLYRVLARQRFFRPPPTSLQGATLELNYVSPFARAQKASEADAVLRTWQAVAMISQAAGTSDPIDVLNPVESARVVAEAYAVPHRIFRDVREVQAVQEQRAQLAQEDRGMEQAGQGAEVLKRLSEAIAPQQQAAA